MDDKQVLLKRDAEWSAIASEGRDIDAILSFWTDDATVIPPGSAPVTGKPALRGFVESSLNTPGFQISWTSTDVTISEDGTMACLVGDNAVSVDGPDGQRMTLPGRVVTVWRKEADGEWRCAVDIWNSAATD